MTQTISAPFGTVLPLPSLQTELGRPDRLAIARERFDAYFMQEVLEQALPKNASNVFGHGFAGGVMRSMLAEKVAVEISKRGVVSIAGRTLSQTSQTSRTNPSPSPEQAKGTISAPLKEGALGQV